MGVCSVFYGLEKEDHCRDFEMSFLLLLTVVQYVLHTTAGGDMKVLLVSMDGFRNDYLTKTKTPSFDKLIASGVTMAYMNNSFVTNTFPCHYTMATGLYPETHGILANTMYDPEFNRTFTMANTESRWWEGGEPIWITAVKHGLQSGVYFWPGSEAAIHDRKATQWRKYNQTVPFKERVDTVVSWLSEGKFDLGVMYFHEPDSSGHRLGPNDPNLLPVIEEMDKILEYLMLTIENSGLKDKVNLIVTSDHGMTDIDLAHRVVDISRYANSSVLKSVVDQGSSSHMRPQEGKDRELVAALSGVEHLHVFLKEDIPERFHLKNNRRVMPVFAYADEGWMITTNATTSAQRANTSKGSHGYDNELINMKPIFIASGPAFKVNATVDPIRSVDIYPLICHLLNMTGAPNNGSLYRGKTLLNSSFSEVHSSQGSTSQSVWMEASYTLVFILASLNIYIYMNPNSVIIS
ncbi:unnamed protein product [Lymnaea stagnalis]|uniref:Ectonucleotide pyrophosphatase/phosphodiesterase family member 5 n=1 Tax=Lymnaea stagnalis TaxID=6523 RepID=A0AAV2IK65_LYMST